eukprot:gene30834-35872_t
MQRPWPWNQEVVPSQDTQLHMKRDSMSVRPTKQLNVADRLPFAPFNSSPFNFTPFRLQDPMPAFPARPTKQLNEDDKLPYVPFNFGAGRRQGARWTAKETSHFIQLVGA